MATAYKCALVTGASSGIGAAFAQALAAAGTDLILVARSAGKLEALAAQLRTQHARQVDVLVADLGQPGAAATLAAAVAARGLQVDLLINNAGFGSAAWFANEDPAHAQRMIALNCAALVDLAHAFVPAMLAQGHGGLINVASMAAFQPAPYMSLYGATKAFVLSYSEGLWAECRGRGVKVLALCPGPVDTGFFAAAGDAGLRDAIPAGMMMQPEAVVAQALRALARGDAVAVPGGLNKLAALFPRLLPRSWVTRLAARVMLEPQRRQKQQRR